MLLIDIICVMLLSKTKKYKYSPFLVALVSMAIIGVNAVFSKIGFETIDPILFMALRYMGIGFVLLIVIRNSIRKVTKEAYKELAIACFILLTMITIWSYGLDQSTALKAALLSLTTPVFMYLFSVTFLKEKVIKTALVGCLIALSGSLIMVGLPAVVEERVEVGDILLLIGYILYALTITHSKKLYTWYRPIEVVGYRLAIVGVVLFLFCLFNGSIPELANASAAGWLTLALSIVVTGIIGLSMHYWALSKMKGEQFAPLLYVEPMTGAIAAAVILGEALDPLAVVGAAIILIGVSISHPHHSKTFHYFHIRRTRNKIMELASRLGRALRHLTAP